MNLPLQNRFLRCLLLVGVTTVSSIIPSTSFAEHLVANPTAARLGLQRAWFAQVRVDASVHKVVHWLLDKDQLFALTSAGVVQAFNAETGETLWTSELGVGHAPSAGNRSQLAACGDARCGTHLHHGPHGWPSSLVAANGRRFELGAGAKQQLCVRDAGFGDAWKVTDSMILLPMFGNISPKGELTRAPRRPAKW